jgi:hypothetical protein
MTTWKNRAWQAARSTLICKQGVVGSSPILSTTNTQGSVHGQRDGPDPLSSRARFVPLTCHEPARWRALAGGWRRPGPARPGQRRWHDPAGHHMLVAQCQRHGGSRVTQVMKLNPARPAGGHRHRMTVWSDLAGRCRHARRPAASAPRTSRLLSRPRRAAPFCRADFVGSAACP